MSCISVCALVLLLSSLISSYDTVPDYFWRDYTGKIPGDAIVAGEDVNGDDVYIGQAYIKNEGLFVAQITPGVKEVYAPIKGARRADDNIKILCGALENFAWLPTNSTRLHLDLLNKRPVFGGHEDGLGKIYIGRISYEGGTQIGKINAFVVGNSWFRWVNKKKEEPSTTSYEVLIYKNEVNNILSS